MPIRHALAAKAIAALEAAMAVAATATARAKAARAAVVVATAKRRSGCPHATAGPMQPAWAMLRVLP